MHSMTTIRAMMLLSAGALVVASAGCAAETGDGDTATAQSLDAGQGSEATNADANAAGGEDVGTSQDHIFWGGWGVPGVGWGGGGWGGLVWGGLGGGGMGWGGLGWGSPWNVNAGFNRIGPF